MARPASIVTTLENSRVEGASKTMFVMKQKPQIESTWPIQDLDLGPEARFLVPSYALETGSWAEIRVTETGLASQKEQQGKTR